MSPSKHGREVGVGVAFLACVAPGPITSTLLPDPTNHERQPCHPLILTVTSLPPFSLRGAAGANHRSALSLSPGWVEMSAGVPTPPTGAMGGRLVESGWGVGRLRPGSSGKLGMACVAAVRLHVWLARQSVTEKTARRCTGFPNGGDHGDPDGRKLAMYGHRCIDCMG
ncbi:hypothetical protein BT67DRAFT_69779 [Trichocladium antarcticum]|uniref:Uncharacterized protein n=1 Tax=Trichocladium antarcticum TaxID=1450529 RepID=A0AAN6ZCB3_9PEZI|nr:hypothetical protein BT67DRAFT_69779 [Trichocladium antarcticum]